MHPFFPPGPEERFYFSLWLYSYESFVEHYDWVIEFVESTFAFGDQFGVGLQFVADMKPRGKEVRRKFTPKTWEWCKQELREGRLWMLLTHPKDFAAPKTLYPVWSVNMLSSIHPREVVADDSQTVPYWKLPLPNEIKFVIELPLTIPHIDPELQQALVHLGRTTFTKIKAIYGFINLSRRPASADVGGTEYERRRDLLADQTTHLLRWAVRGAFWENYLSEGHIQALGGIDSIKASAPCARVDELIEGKALAVRLTEDVNELSLVLVQKLEAYFQPLAPSLDSAK
ncbi:MAG: hypothetical protein HZB51_21240 [Chloroflexi bacterium]|nr:hypothetical protein [Chloroflexota bacterium]